MKVLHVVPSFFPALNYGGPIESVLQLCSHTIELGADVRVLTTDANGPDEVLNVNRGKDVELGRGLWIRYCHRIGREAFSPELFYLLPRYILWADVIHLTGVYSPPTPPTLLVSRVFKKPVVWSPRGSFRKEGLRNRQKLKAIINLIYRYIVPGNLILHVTSIDEKRDSLQVFPSMKTALIPNGVAVPEKIERRDEPGEMSLLYLGRLHPIKGIENLLEACHLVDAGSFNFRLIIAGQGDEEYVEELRKEITKLELKEKVEMVGYINESEKQDIFQQADVLILPSHSENFGNVVAEALSYGIPVIASRGTPWSRVEEVGCGLWVNNDPKILAEAIEDISKMPYEEMGQRGREWMQQEFSWSSIAAAMMETYEEMLQGCTS